MTLVQEFQVAARLLGRVLARVGALGELSVRVTRETDGPGRTIVDISWNHSVSGGGTWHHAIGGDKSPAAAVEYALTSLCKQLAIGDPK